MKKVSTLCLVLILINACSVHPDPFTVKARYAQAQQDIKQIFSSQHNLPARINFYEALARGIKYDLDYRIKLANTALQAGQLKVAEYTMFPALNATGSVYTRNNDLASSGISSGGGPTGVFNSTPRTLRSSRISVGWNLLEFGMGYVRAKQQSERILMAQEESRKQLQLLTQDVLVAYWKAYGAQEMMKDTKQFQALLMHAKEQLKVAIRDKGVPRENLLTYQAALFEGSKRFSQLQYQYDKAILDLKHLINFPLDRELILASPPLSTIKMQAMRKLDFYKMDAITLVTRPELRGQNYQQRIAKFGVKAALLQAVPGFTLNYGWNYNSNKYLLNPAWIDKSFDIAWNLLNLASMPTNYKAAQLQVEYEKLKLLALTLTALTETRYAYAHYITLQDEYFTSKQQTANANDLYRLIKNRNLAMLASTQQVILAKLKTITAKMDEDLLISELSRALGELYLSIGMNVLPLDVDKLPLDNVVKEIESKFNSRSKLDFAEYINQTYNNLFSIKTSPPPKLSAQNNAAYSLQVYGSYHISDVKRVHAQLKLKKRMTSAYFHTKHNGRNWYVLTVGKFKNLQQAKHSISQLPPKIRQLKPWVRDINQLALMG